MAKTNSSTTDTTENPAAGATSGRVLQSFTHAGIDYRANDLFEGFEEEVAAHHAAGNIDAHPDAVPHAKARAEAQG